MKRLAAATCFLLLAIYALIGQDGRVEAVEVGRATTSLLPGGKEADGIIGDFVLRNDKIHALIGGNLPLRRPNMSTEYRFPTPGCLYDLDLRGAENDQITVFRPGGLGGELSWVRVVKDGVVEAVRTAPKGDGLYERHEYRVEPGWQYVMVASTYRNESREPKKIAPPPVWKQFSQEWKAGEVRVGDSIDPFDKRAYAWAPVGKLDAEATLAPGEERTYTVMLAVANSPLAAYGVIAGVSGGDVTGTIAAPNGAIVVDVEGAALPAYPDAQGRLAFRLPRGAYRARLVDIGREELWQELRVGSEGAIRLAVPPASAIEFDIRDAAGSPSPAKVQFIGVGGTPTPNLGTDYRARGGDHQYQSYNGRFTQQVPPGRYLLRITRGIEHDLAEMEVEVPKGQTVKASAVLRRTVDTKGWISTDYHAHSTPSGDNYCNTDDRITNFVAEHIEFAPTTEHNRIYDWRPHIEKLGVGKFLKTIIGIELTGSGQHFNSFPLRRTLFAQDGGAPLWNPDPRITAITLRDFPNSGPDRWVQANHPIVGTVFNDRNGDGIHDGGYAGFERLIDAAEVWSTEILNPDPSYTRVRAGQTQKLENRTLGWLQMLNQGRHVWCVAVSDAHRIFSNGVGGWRTYVPSSTDEPDQIDHAEIIRNSKAGRMMITNGPFLEVTTADGLPIGSTVVAEGFIDLKVKVQVPNWIEVDRVQVLVNGRPGDNNYTRRTHPALFEKRGAVVFDQTIRVHLQRDAHLIVVAAGENSDLSKGYGRSWESGMRPVAYTNPIYVDVDHNGFQANGDTLGHPLLVTPR
jgi:hypothetical protein